MAWSANLDPALSGSSGQWLWTPHNATGPGDNSKGPWALGCNLNLQVISTSDPMIISRWINNLAVPLKIVRTQSAIGTEFRQVTTASPGGLAFPGGQEGAPIGQYNGAIEIQELPSGERLAIHVHAPSVFVQGYLPWEKDITYPAGDEPIIQPGDALWFINNTFWPYSGGWNVQYDLVAYFKF